MNRQFTTSKGTQLPLLNLRGKDYLEVKYRVVWFREEHPDWSIETAFLSTDDESATARAVIRDPSGRIVATSHKAEHISGFPDFLEKAETGAIGRALALIGYGTQFCADELDEGSRIVDAPVIRPTFSARTPKKEVDPFAFPVAEPEAVPPAAAASSPEGGDAAGGYYFDKYRIAFGKYRGKRLVDVSRKDLEGYLSWLQNQADKKNSALSAEAAVLTRMAQLYFAHLDKGTEVEESAEGAASEAAQAS